MQSPSPVPLSEEQIEPAGSLLARAFHNNPLLIHMSPDEGDRRRSSPAFFSAFVRYGYLAGEVSATDGTLDGVAVWLPPDAVEMDPDLMDQAGISALPSTVGAEAFGRIMTVFGHLDVLHKRDVQVPHWYLTLIGVDPQRQRQGIAGSLLRPMLAHADAERLPCYLETAEPANVPFYLNMGFEIVVEEVEPKSGIEIWTFLRQPMSE
jgi:ribosomal protein S18 acetylase RimI-like enzyme